MLINFQCSHQIYCLNQRYVELPDQQIYLREVRQMHINTHQISRIKFISEKNNLKKRIKLKFSIKAATSKRSILNKLSAKNNYPQNDRPASKHNISSEQNGRCKTLPRLHRSLSKVESVDKEITKNIYDSLVITTKNWCLFDSNKNQYYGFRQDYRRQIASLTKIMTSLISISQIQKLNISLSTFVRVTRTASEMIGTTASLKEDAWITIEDLLYGAMLPSGNDAAYTLAEYIGYLISIPKDKHSKRQKVDLTKMNTNGFVQEFVLEMNKRAYQLGLYNTRFSNPHGLQNALNSSSAKDIVKLSQTATKSRLFSAIMNTHYHKYEYFQGEQLRECHLKRWWNTNKLLQKGWQGVKTGYTASAGGCLSSMKEGIFITVLNSSSTESRFTDTEKIFQWYKKYAGEGSGSTIKTSFQLSIMQEEYKLERNLQTEFSI